MISSVFHIFLFSRFDGLRCCSLVSRIARLISFYWMFISVGFISSIRPSLLLRFRATFSLIFEIRSFEISLLLVVDLLLMTFNLSVRSATSGLWSDSISAPGYVITLFTMFLKRLLLKRNQFDSSPVLSYSLCQEATSRCRGPFRRFGSLNHVLVTTASIS